MSNVVIQIVICNYAVCTDFKGFFLRFQDLRL